MFSPLSVLRGVQELYRFGVGFGVKDEDNLVLRGACTEVGAMLNGERQHARRGDSPGRRQGTQGAGVQSIHSRFVVVGGV